MARPTKRRTVLAYLRTASEKMERAIRTAIRCNEVPPQELRALLNHYRQGLQVESSFRKGKRR